MAETLEDRLLAVARKEPGVRALDAIADGRLPYAHSSVKRAAAALRAKGLLWPSRPAWLLLTAEGRAWAKGHPCEEVCWRVGAPVTLGATGTCPECGKPDRRHKLDRRELEVLRAIAEASPILQAEFLEEHCGHIAASSKPALLVSLRSLGLLVPWNGLVAKDEE